MRVISIINLKGGVGKTVSAINIAHILAANYKARVLLIDNDKQGNASKFFGLHSYDLPSVADVLTGRAMPIAEVVRHSQYARLDLVPANMGLLTANSSLLVDTSRTRDYRMRSSLEVVADQYDWCVIDNAPDINISVINALMASDDVLIPVKIDRFASTACRSSSSRSTTYAPATTVCGWRAAFSPCTSVIASAGRGTDWMPAGTALSRL